MITALREREAERDQAEAELRNYREHLEDLVKERTEELAKATRQAEEAREIAESATHAKSDFLAKEIRPNVITLVVLMPGMDGWVVLTSLKADPQLADIPVIILIIVDQKNLGFALGASDQFAKPVDRDRLVATILPA